MKTVDLNRKILSIPGNKVAFKLLVPRTLLSEVVKYLSNSTSFNMEESVEVMSLVDILKKNPAKSITDRQVRLIEAALISAPVDTKATWADMINSLNSI